MFVPDFLRQGMGGGNHGPHVHRVGWGKYMQAETRALLKSLGCELTYGLIEQTQQRLAAALSPPEEQPLVIRDLPYGPMPATGSTCSRVPAWKARRSSCSCMAAAM